MTEPRLNSLDVLKRTALFSGLAENEISFLAERAVSRRFSAGELLFSEGDPCQGLWVVAAGSIRIFKTSPAGREQVLGIEGQYASIAELPVFDGGNYPASASAVDDATLLLVRKQDFHALCMQHPAVALKVLRVVGARLRRLVGIIEELSFTTVRHRLAALLFRLATQEGKKTARGIEFQLPYSNQELASHIGTVRELVSRNLSRFQAEGLVKMDGRDAVVPDLKALEAELRSED